ncbi:serine--tRNA ligase [Candidatus Micrarchaeota archaeon]|nr:serine--tRNA ligase [Candidatus Micrarchaeota archaeon]
MIDIKLLRENPELFKKDLKRRKSDFPIDDVIEKDKQWRQNLYNLEQKKSLKNKVSAEISKTKDKTKITEMKKLGDEIKKLEEKVAKQEADVRSMLMRTPNLLHESVPYGESDKDNAVVRKWGKAEEKSFELKPHGEYLEENGFADFERATKVSGAGFYYLKGDLVFLDLALMKFALDCLAKKGYTPTETPLMMTRKAYEGVTDLSDFEKVMYKIENEDEYLIATSEHPMAAMYMDEIIPNEALPIKLAGISQCFRREIGSHGVDTKGLFRVHQFNKIEQFIFCEPKDSWKLHEELLKNAEEIMQALEIPYRVVNVCTGDIGTVAAKKYDIEAWSPREKKYFEVASCSNCTDYQARRLNIRAGKSGGEKRMLHTLNSTAIATSRVLRAILENHQQKDGSITIPKALQPHFGKAKITPKKK